MERIVLVPVTLAIATPEGANEDDAYVADAVNEILRGQQRCFLEGSDLLDYSIELEGTRDSTSKPTLADDEVYEEGDAL